MSHLIWCQDLSADSPNPDAELVNPQVVSGLSFLKSNPLPSPFPPVRISIGGQLADYFKIGPMHVVSEQLASVLRKVIPPAAVDFHPVQVTRGGTTVATKFHCMHPRLFVDALDWDRSEYMLFRNWARELKTIVLTDNAAPHPMLILERVAAPTLLVREDVAEELRKHSFSGLVLQPV